MEGKFLKGLKKFSQSFLIGLGAMVLVTTVVYATATTIGTNILTTGTLGVTGLSTFTSVTSTSATSTSYIYIGPDGTENLFNFTGGDLYVADDAEVKGTLLADSASTTDTLYAGGYASSTGGLFTLGNAHIGGTFTVDGNATTSGDLVVEGGTIDNNTTTSTSTPGIFSRAHLTSTSTIGIGSQGNSIGGCLEMVRQSSNSYFKCYINDAGNFTCEAGRCN